MWYNKKADTKKRSAENGKEHNNYTKMSLAQKEKRCLLLTQICENKGGCDMLVIKKNRIVSTNVSMSLPEGFGIVTNDNLYFDDCIRFNSKTGLIKFGVVTIEFSLRKAKQSAQEDLGKFGTYGTRLRGEIQSITRGSGTAYCAFYNGIPGYMDMYAEKYDFPTNKRGKNRFDLRVFIRAGKGKTLVQNVEYALTIPIVKQFLDSIEYK